MLITFKHNLKGNPHLSDEIGQWIRVKPTET